MIDIQLLRNDIDTVARRLATRGVTLDVAAFGALEDARKRIQTSTEQLQARRNALSKQVGQAKAKKDDAQAAALMAQAAGLGEELKQMQAENEALRARQHELVALLPNLPHASVAVGACAAQKS